MSTQSNSNTNAGARNKWLWLGGLVALLVVLVVLGVALALNRSGQNGGSESAPNSAPVVTPGANAPADPHALAAGSFAEAGKTWGEIEQARAGLDQAIQTEKLEQVHQAAFAVRDQVRRLPEHSAALPAPQRQELQAHVQHVDQLAQMLDEAGDTKNVRSTHQHHVALNDTLAKIRALYPEGALPAGSAANGTGGMTGGMMDDDKMGGMSGGMSGGMMDDKMGGMSSGGMKNAPSGGMSGGMMNDDKMGGMSGGSGMSGGKGMSGGMMDDDKMGGMSGGGMPADQKAPAKKAPAKQAPGKKAPAQDGGSMGGGGMGGHM